MLENAVLLVDGHHGIYVPQIFAEAFDLGEWGVAKEDIEILKSGPDHQDYWDAWWFVLMNATCTNEEGTWYLRQDDGDLWAVKEEDD